MREFVLRGGTEFKLTIAPTSDADIGDKTIKVKREVGSTGTYETTSIQLKIKSNKPLSSSPTLGFKESLPFILTKYLGDAWQYKLPSVNNPNGLAYTIKTTYDASFVTWS